MQYTLEERKRETNKVTVVCMIGNILLSFLKLFAGVVGMSAAMVADALHSFSDIATDIVVLLGAHFGNKPEDDLYPYGHGKLETFATLIIAIILLFVGFSVLSGGVKSVYAVIKGAVLPKPGYIALAMAAVSIITKEAMFHYTHFVGKKVNSSSVISNAWHHRSDAISSIATFIGIGGAILLGQKWTVLDPITAIVVSFFIFAIGFQVAKVAIKEMLDVSLSQEEIEDIKSICSSINGVVAQKEIRSRRIGYRVSIELGINLSEDMSFTEVYDKMCLIENKLRGRFGEFSFISIHPEPAQNLASSAQNL